MPHERVRTRPSGSRLLSFSSAFLSFGILPVLILHGDVVFSLISICAGCLAIAAGLIIDREPTNGIALLWTTVGILLAEGVAGIFTIGLLFIISGIVVLMAISAAPNPNGHSWFGFKFIIPEIVSFVATFALILH